MNIAQATIRRTDAGLRERSKVFLSEIVNKEFKAAGKNYESESLKDLTWLWETKPKLSKPLHYAI
jgi:hypothetical protein